MKYVTAIFGIISIIFVTILNFYPDKVRDFIDERNWDQFHTPGNLAKSISIEAGELLECFQWNDTEYDLNHVAEEIADVIIYSQQLLDKLGLDMDEIVQMKMIKNAKKYPVEKTKDELINRDLRK